MTPAILIKKSKLPFLKKIFTTLAIIKPNKAALNARPIPERSFLVTFPIKAIAKNIADAVTNADKTDD